MGIEKLTIDNLNINEIEGINYCYLKMNSDCEGVFDVPGIDIIQTRRTVLLKPSEVSKYYTVQQCKDEGIGELVYEKIQETIPVIKMTEDGKWCYVANSDGFVRLVPANTLELDVYKDPNPDKVVSNNGIGPIWDSSLYKRIKLYDVSNAPIIDTNNAILYEMPDESYISDWQYRYKAVAVTSLWQNLFDNSKYYSIYLMNGKTYYVNISNVKIVTKTKSYYAMCYDDITCCHTYDDNEVLYYTVGDILHFSYRNYLNELAFIYKNQNNQIFGASPFNRPSSGYTPNVHSDDVFNLNVLGKLTISGECKTKTIDIEKINNDTNISKPNNQYLITITDLSLMLKNENINFLDILYDGDEFVAVNRIISHDGIEYYVASKYRSDSHLWYLIENNENVTYEKFNSRQNSINTDTTTNQGVTNIIQNTAEYTNYALNSKSSGIETKDVSIQLNEKVNEETKSKWYEAEVSFDKEFDIPGMYKNTPEIEPSDNNYHILTESMHYNLQTSIMNDNRHMRKFNRFRFLGQDSGLSTKSFIFMTRPDLNLYKETLIETDYGISSSIDPYSMNPDLLRLPTFKYIGRLKNACRDIMASLEYMGTNSIDSPWLYIVSNQARGYEIPDRKIDIVETGETFHGNKIIYGEPTFSHKIAGTVSIPFIERRDLSLYYTLRLWVEYIQAVSMGRCNPRFTHMMNHEIDYAVSLYYITTDESMENILYWEKLIGVFPLSVPDSFFSWNNDSSAREMKYNIDFAYSFRAVQDEFHLLEINNLYRKKTNRIDSIDASYNDFNYSYDSTYNTILSKLAASYNHINDTDEARNKFTNDKNMIEKYYYANNININSSGYSLITDNSIENLNVKFLPNWIPSLHTHGVPYVKGPFITKEMERNSDDDVNSKSETGMYKLRWV